MDQALNARSNLNECAVVGHDDNLTLNMVADLEFSIQSIPRMRSELLQTESDALLLLVEVEDNHVELLVEFHNLVRIADAAPAEVCDVYETVDTTQVDEYTIGSDVLDGTLQHLTLLQLGDDLALLGFELGFDEEKKRIALGLKQLTPHPWDALDPNLKVGDHVKGKVVVMADYGAFIEIAPGVEGLIHVSEMSWSQHLRSAQDFMKVGDEVEAVILTLDREERKMSLGIKQLKEDPWENIEQRYPVGSKHTARVRNFTNFGVFVEIEEGVDGLIHISDLSWTKKVKHPSEFTKIGEDIEVVVLEIDKENRRLSLGHKQLEENPWDVFETVFTVDSVHEGTITELLDRGAVIQLEYGVEGFATPKHLVKEDGSQAQLGEKLPFKVIEFNKDSKRIILSHSRIYEDEARREAREARKAERAATKRPAKAREEQPVIQNQAASTTLGDIDALAALKAKMEQGDE